MSSNRSGWPTKTADKSALRELVARFGSILGQETMFLEFTDSVIEFIPPARTRNSLMGAMNHLMNVAEQAAQEAESWADLSNFLFNPDQRIGRQGLSDPRGAGGLRQDRGVPEAPPIGHGRYGSARARRGRDTEEERPFCRPAAAVTATPASSDEAITRGGQPQPAGRGQAFAVGLGRLTGLAIEESISNSSRYCRRRQFLLSSPSLTGGSAVEAARPSTDRGRRNENVEPCPGCWRPRPARRAAPRRS